MTELRSCEGCKRRVYVTETSCPFCRALLQPARPAPSRLLPGMSRAQALAVAAAAVSSQAATGCNDGQTTLPITTAGQGGGQTNGQAGIDASGQGGQAGGTPATGGVGGGSFAGTTGGSGTTGGDGSGGFFSGVGGVYGGAPGTGGFIGGIGGMYGGAFAPPEDASVEDPDAGALNPDAGAADGGVSEDPDWWWWP